MTAAGAERARGLAWRLWALVPLVGLALAVAVVVSVGDRVVELVGGTAPPADEFDVRRVELRPGEVRVLVRNPQRDDLTIATVTVDDAIVPYTLDGPATLGRLRSSTIVVPYDWVPGDPLAVGVTSSTGIQTTHEIAAAVQTPEPGARGVLGYGLIGLLVGVVPVALGLLWLPSLRRASPAWIAAFMALTAGLLTFLGVEALFEALALQAGLPPAFGGPGLVLLGLAASALGMTFLAARLSRGRVGLSGLALALLVAIGTSFATGEVQLGAFLVIGFMVHNVTEGLGIAAPATRTRVRLWQLAGLALVAGAPAILGTWIGGYGSSDLLTPVFFALAAGAALQVVVEVARHVARIAPGGLRSGWAVGGYLAGIAAMWATGLLVG